MVESVSPGISLLRTLSSFSRLNNLRILEARLGPKRRGMVESVSPGISLSPFFSITTEMTDTSLGEDTLFHGETLLVVSTGDTENVTSPFITKGGSIDLLAHTLLIEGTNLNFIVDLEKLLAARSWIRH